MFYRIRLEYANPYKSLENMGTLPVGCPAYCALPALESVAVTLSNMITIPVGADTLLVIPLYAIGQDYVNRLCNLGNCWPYAILTIDIDSSVLHTTTDSDRAPEQLTQGHNMTFEQDNALSHVLLDGTTTINHASYQKKVKSMTSSQLHWTIKDAREAMEAMPLGHKSGYYADEILYCASELGKRRRA